MKSANILRIFPRRTKATPSDRLVVINKTPDLFPPDGIDEIHVSVAFTYDKSRGEQLADAWSMLGYPVKIGGPAYNEPGDIFVPGRYLKPGYVITSRGCPNNCWFCSVPKREGRKIRELPVADGWKVLDDNLLACSPTHRNAVFDMLARQPHPVEFTGGLESKRLTPAIAEQLAKLRIQTLYFAYDEPDDFEPLIAAVDLLKQCQVKIHNLRCYVLMGYQDDSFALATKRLEAVCALGVMPMAMLFKGQNDNEQNSNWDSFQRTWAAPQSIRLKMKQVQSGLKTVNGWGPVSRTPCHLEATAPE